MQHWTGDFIMLPECFLSLGALMQFTDSMDELISLHLVSEFDPKHITLWKQPFENYPCSNYAYI